MAEISKKKTDKKLGFLRGIGIMDWRKRGYFVLIFIGIVLAIILTITVLFYSWELAATVATVFGAFAAIIAFAAYIQDIRWNFYQYLADLYYDMFSRGLENSEFLDPEITKTYKNLESSDRQKYYKYCAYAHMCWAYAEDIYDADKNYFYYLYKGYFIKLYANTFERIKNLHGAWFEDEDNQKQFMDDFREFVKREEWKKYL